MPEAQNSKPLSYRAIESMKPGAKDLSDTGEYRGLRVTCGSGGTKSFLYRYKSPVTGKLIQKIKLTSQPGRRSLSDTELRQLLRWLPGSAYSATQKGVIRMALWTGCRTGEIVEAEWKHIDLDKKVWHLPETKTEVERYVQIPDQAVSFLRQLKLTTGTYVFPSQKTKLSIQQKQLTEQAWRMKRDGNMQDIENWTPHDLMRSVRTGLSRLGCPNEVGEAVFGHSKKGIQGTYDLH
ncbi:MAG: site-specific integrase [Gammaproteobacteria bacterium]|nr:site-specific integrase [Gammaproteobacteria bacterium]